MKRLISFALVLLLGKSHAQAVSDSVLVSTFYQNGANNCASIALIKAGMIKFGYSSILTYYKNKDVFNVVLRDGIKLSIPESELTLAKRYAEFGIDEGLSYSEKDSVIFYAYLAYASIGKFVQTIGYWDCAENNSWKLPAIPKYENALKFISHRSFCTDNCHKLLGFNRKSDIIFDFTASSDLTQRGIILYSWPHAVVAFNDQLDCYGNILTARSNKPCGQNFKWLIILQ